MFYTRRLSCVLNCVMHKRGSLLLQLPRMCCTAFLPLPCFLFIISLCIAALNLFVTISVLFLLLFLFLQLFTYRSNVSSSEATQLQNQLQALEKKNKELKAELGTAKTAAAKLQAASASEADRDAATHELTAQLETELTNERCVHFLRFVTQINFIMSLFPSGQRQRVLWPRLIS